MSVTPKEVARKIENAEINDTSPAKVGLKMLQDAYAEQLARPGSYLYDADTFIHGVREKLIADGFMSGITFEYVASQMRAGEKITGSLEVYSSGNSSETHPIEPRSDLEFALKDDFADRLTYIADGTVGFWSRHTVSYEGLKSAVKRSDAAVTSLKVGEELKQSGVGGALWQILQGADPNRNITLDAVEHALNQPSTSLSDNQISALRDLKANWNTDAGAKRFAVIWSQEFNPYPSLNLMTRSKYGTYQYRAQQVNYLTPQVVNYLLARVSD